MDETWRCRTPRRDRACPGHAPERPRSVAAHRNPARRCRRARNGRSPRCRVRSKEMSRTRVRMTDNSACVREPRGRQRRFAQRARRSVAAAPEHPDSFRAHRFREMERAAMPAEEIAARLDQLHRGTAVCAVHRPIISRARDGRRRSLLRPDQIAEEWFNTVGDDLVSPVVWMDRIRHPVSMPDDPVENVRHEPRRRQARHVLVVLPV